MFKRTVCAELYDFRINQDRQINQFVKRDGRWQAIGQGEGFAQLEALGLGLRELGVKKGVPVAVISRTRLEWPYLDMAIMSIGGITVGIYDNLTSQDVGYIVEHSEACVVVVENQAMLDMHLEAILACPAVVKIVVIEDSQPAKDSQLISYSQLIELGEKQKQKAPDLFGQLVDQVEPDDIATYMYTSGTTGTPKGVILDHRNLYETATASRGILPLEKDDVHLFFLPLSHILQRMTTYIGTDGNFGSVYFAESLDKLVDNIAEVRPTVMTCVPRIFEKAHARVMSRIETLNSRRQKIFTWALGVGLQVSRLKQKKQPIPYFLTVKFKLADRLVLSKIRAALGGRPNFFAVGGAPLAKDLAEFFHACSIMLLEGYGLSETSAVTCLNRPDSFKFGTVGRPVPGTEIRIAQDGEILIKGPGVFRGYLKDPQKTASVFEDGWFKTGDIGHLDQDGFLVITDRKKNIIVTAGGKNIAPQKIENLIKLNPLISQVMVQGDRRSFLSAVITLDPEELGLFAKLRGIADCESRQLINHPEVKNEVERAIEAANQKLARFETIKKHAILDKEFSVESGELTPSLKVKRKVVTQRHQNILDGFYE
ncbi:MAG: long-chain fatty acid--CoA ligase [Deltaproteobacteria bacterium]|nr:long-chain fatty acid--CoA ligase [Deltaproteobacteria bacterium]